MKKPSIDEFAEALERAAGNLTDAAGLLGVTRQAVYNWIKEDDEFSDALKCSRKKTFDRALDTAKLVAFGIPKIDNGKLTGWKERPDTRMLIYLLTTIGRDEGFGNNVDLTTDGDKLPTVINVIRSDSADLADEK